MNLLASRRSPSKKKEKQRPYRHFRPLLEQLEARLAPATFLVDPQLQVHHLDNVGGTPGSARSVVFFESSVADYQVLRQGLTDGNDAVILDSHGDGVRAMAAFLAGRHDLAAVHVVAHGTAGTVDLGSAILDDATLAAYAGELATTGAALRPGAGLDLWSCDVAAGPAGETFVRDLAAATGAGVAAASHLVGATDRGGSWQLDVTRNSGTAGVPFDAAARADFHGLLGASWFPAQSLITGRAYATATLLNNGLVLVVGGASASARLSSAELYNPAANLWSATGSLNTGRYLATATLLPNGKVLVVGGAGSSGILASAELYDPATGNWSSTGSLNTARC